MSTAGNTNVTIGDIRLSATDAHGPRKEDTVMQQLPHGNFYDVGRTHSSFTGEPATMRTIPLEDIVLTEDHSRKIILILCWVITSASEQMSSAFAGQTTTLTPSNANTAF